LHLLLMINPNCDVA